MMNMTISGMTDVPAFRALPLRLQLPFAVECMTMCTVPVSQREFIFVGTQDSRIAVCAIQPEAGGSEYSAVLIHMETSRRRSPVRFLAPLIECGVCVALVGDTIAVHRLDAEKVTSVGMGELSALTTHRQVVTVSVRKYRAAYTLAVVTKKAVQLYEVRSDINSGTCVLVPLRECPHPILIPDTPRAVAWTALPCALIVATKREYLLLHCATGELERLFAVGASRSATRAVSEAAQQALPSSSSAAVPFLMSMAPVPEVLAAVGPQSHWCARLLRDGTPAPGESDFIWPGVPLSAAYVHPFTLAVHAAGQLSVYFPLLTTLYTQTDAVSASLEPCAGGSTPPVLCQAIDIPGVGTIAQAIGYTDMGSGSSAAVASAAAAASRPCVAVLDHAGTLFLLQATPAEAQVRALAATGRLEAAQLLCQLYASRGLSPDVARHVKVMIALRHYKSGALSQCVRVLRDADVEVQVILALFPNVQPMQAVDATSLPVEVIQAAKERQAKMEDDMSRGVQEALPPLAEYLTLLRNRLPRSGEAALRPNDAGAIVDDAAALRSYLDTALLKCLVLAGQEAAALELVDTSARGAHSGLDTEASASRDLEWSRTLMEHHQWVLLAALWRKWGDRHEKTLSLLKFLCLTGSTVASPEELPLPNTMTESVEGFEGKETFRAALALFSANLQRRHLFQIHSQTAPSGGASNNDNSNRSELSVAHTFVLQQDLTPLAEVAMRSYIKSIDPPMREQTYVAEEKPFAARAVAAVVAATYLGTLSLASTSDARVFAQHMPWLLEMMPTACSLAPLLTPTNLPFYRQSLAIICGYAGVQTAPAREKVKEEDTPRDARALRLRTVLADFLSSIIAYLDEAAAATPIGANTSEDGAADVDTGTAGYTHSDTDIYTLYWQTLAWIVRASAGLAAASEETDIYRPQLLRFLSSSSCVDLAGAEVFFEQPEWASACAAELEVIYRRRKRHRAAIAMYIPWCSHAGEAGAEDRGGHASNTNNADRSERLASAARYAATVKEQDGDGDAFRELFMCLLPLGDASSDILTRTQLQREQGLADALHILNTCPHVDPLAVLPMLPDDLSLSNAVSTRWLASALRDSTASCNDAELWLGMCEARKARAERNRSSSYAQGMAVVTPDTRCDVCRRPLHADSVLVCYPDGTLAHQACAPDVSVSPVSHVDFCHGVAAAWPEEV